MLVRACCCGPSTACDYADDFAYLRDYEISLRETDSASAPEFPATVARAPEANSGGPIDLEQADLDGNLHDLVGGGGWYTSALRPVLTLQDCLEGCDDPPATFTVAVPVWSVAVENTGQRLFCRQSPLLEWPVNTPGGACNPLPVAEYGTASSVGWSYADIGHLLRRYTAASVSDPVVTIAAQLFNDPTYATSWNRGLANSLESVCEPAASGGYYEWGLHVGEAVYGAARTSPGDTGTANVVRLCLDRSAESLGSTTATKYLRIWDAAGEYTQVNLGSATVSLATSVPLSLTLTRTGDDIWTIDAEGHTETGVALDFGDMLTAPEIPMGVYCLGTAFDDDPLSHHGGGEWSDLCVTGVAMPDSCGDCATPNLPTGWMIDTTIGSEFYSGAMGDCGDPLECQPDGVDPWGGQQILGPVDGSADCCWTTCHNVYACLSGGGCVQAGPAMQICEVDDGGTIKMRLRYLHYAGSTPGSLSELTLATYDAPYADVCGPATFTKTLDNTSGGYFPATIEAVRAWPIQGCQSGDDGEQCCPGLSPDLTIVGGDETTTITITSVDCSAEPGVPGVCSYLWTVALQGVDWYCENTIEATCVFAEAGGTLYWYVRVGAVAATVTSPTGCDPLDLVLEAIDLFNDFECTDPNMPEFIVTITISG